jgi:hypothetical protein
MLEAVRWLLRACIRALALVLLFASNPAFAADYANRRISSVLDELRSQGLIFIYNTEIVPATLRVATEPTARSGLSLAREILAPHLLSLSQVAPNVFAIIRLPTDPAIASRSPPPDVKEPVSLEEVVVLGSRYAVASNIDASQMFLSQEQVKNMPRLADETLRALQRLPGAATNGFSSLSSIRGGEPYETAIVLDGLRLYEPFHLKHFVSPVSMLDSRVIDGMEFYSGGYPVMFGDRMSAIIDAKSVSPMQRRYYEAGLSLFHINALISTDLSEKAKLLVSGRRSNADYIASASETEAGQPNYWDGFAKFDYSLSDSTKASVQMLVSADRTDAIKDAGIQRSRVEYESSYSWFTLEHDWSSDLSSRAIVSYTDVTNERKGTVMDPGRRTAVVLDQRSFHVVGLRLDNAFESSLLGDDALHHRFGGEVRRLWAHYLYTSDTHFDLGFPFPDSPATSQQRNSSPHPAGFESSAYWDARIRLSNQWTAQLGLRFDTQTYDNTDDGEQWSPRLGVLYSPSERIEIRASWGRFFQSQGINELQVEDGVDHFYPAQHANHAIVSISHALSRGIDLRMEMYRKDYRQLNPRFENLYNPLVLLPETEPDRVMIDPSGARSEGVELLLQLRPHGAWSGWLSYTRARVRDFIDGSRVPRSWDQIQAANLGIVWASGPWSVTLADTYHSGWPTTVLEVVPGQSGSPSQVRNGPRNAERLGNYNSLDLRLGRTFVFGRGALDVYVEGSNVASRENPCCVEYRVTAAPDGSPQVIKDVDNWLPLVPSAGILWRY